MSDFRLFLLFYGWIVTQRLFELVIAKRNEKWMKQQGAVEAGQKAYKYIVVMHTLFLLAFLGEKIFADRNLSPMWPLLGGLFLLSQFLRFWAIFSLGKYWNTKIIVLPDADLVCKGPYRFIRHPNYLVVILELLTVPLIFNAYLTACVFTVLNIMLLAIRIAEEEHMLKSLTEYEGIFGTRNRFIPSIFIKYDDEI